MRAGMDVPGAPRALEPSSHALWLLRSDLRPLRRVQREVTPQPRKRGLAAAASRRYERVLPHRLV